MRATPMQHVLQCNIIIGPHRPELEHLATCDCDLAFKMPRIGPDGEAPRRNPISVARKARRDLNPCVNGDCVRRIA
jgi:hypothetical protein